jgi:hypothetical protein
MPIWRPFVLRSLRGPFAGDRYGSWWADRRGRRRHESLDHPSRVVTWNLVSRCGRPGRCRGKPPRPSGETRGSKYERDTNVSDEQRRFDQELEALLGVDRKRSGAVDHPDRRRNGKAPEGGGAVIQEEVQTVLFEMPALILIAFAEGFAATIGALAATALWKEVTSD